MCSEKCKYFDCAASCSLLLLLLLFIGTAMSSCSVFEDRRDCPCLLSLKMDDPANKVSDSLVFILGGDGFADSFRVKSDVSVAERKIFYRGGLRINALSEEAAVNLVGGNIIIPFGEQCPEAYLYGTDCVIDSEEHSESVHLAKNYCGVSMTFLTETVNKYIVNVLGNVCGYDSEGGLIEGDFSYAPDFSHSSESFFRVPRQKDASLRLAVSAGDIYGESGGGGGVGSGDAGTNGVVGSGASVYYFALGNYIEASGYDWTKTDLDDIAISIDFVTCTLSLSINDWKKEFDIDVVI